MHRDRDKGDLVVGAHREDLYIGHSLDLAYVP